MTKLNAEQLADRLNALMAENKLSTATMHQVFKQASIDHWNSGAGEVAVFMTDESLVAYEKGRGWSVYR